MVTLRALGALDLRSDRGHSLTGILAQPKRAALLAYLVLARPGELHRRDSLLALFWPTLDQTRGRAALSQALSFLRRELGEGVLVTRGPDETGVDPDRIQSDVGSFLSAVEGKRWAEALGLFRGDLLEGLHVEGAPGFTDWVDRERTRLRIAAAAAAWRWARELIDSRELVDAQRTAERALEWVATDETPVRGFIEALARAGDRAAALRFYERFKRRLEDELQVDPAPTTVAVAMAVRRGEIGGIGDDALGEHFPGSARGSVPPASAAPGSTSAEAFPTSGVQEPEGSDPVPSPKRVRLPRKRLSTAKWVAVAAGFTALLLLSIFWAGSRAPPRVPANVTRVSVLLPEGGKAQGHWTTQIALSPDGTRMVYVGEHEGRRHLWLRPLDSLRARLLPGTEDARTPFFSPEGDSIGFVVGSGSFRLVLMAAAGGPHRTLVAGVGQYAGAWGEDGMVYFRSVDRQICRVPSSGGEVEVLTSPGRSDGVIGHSSVFPLPNGKGALFSVWRGPPAENGIGVADFETGDVRELIPGIHPLYARSGHLVYVRSDSVLMAAPFDQARMRLTGPARSLAFKVSVNYAGTAEVALSNTGTLLYRSGVGGGSLVQPVWVDREGFEEEVHPGWVDVIRSLALSPDGTRLAVSIDNERGGRDIWIKTLDRSPLQRVAEDTAMHLYESPAWTPDGRHLDFAALLGPGGIWRRRVDGLGPTTLLLNGHGVGLDWSDDGRWLVFRSGQGVHGLEFGSEGQPLPLVVSEAIEGSPALSPDGRWLAYSSGDSGQRQVYVRPFPDTDGGRWQVSVAGGSGPVWAHSGRELFFLNGAQELAVVEVVSGPEFGFTTERALFSAVGYRFIDAGRTYVLSPDDRRFLMLRKAGDTPETILVQNFLEELRRASGSG